MRFTVIPERGDSVILNDTLNNQTIGWYLVDGVVEGWYGTPAPREGTLEVAGRDGDEPPATLTQGPRVVTIYGAIDCPSSIAATRAINDINNLFGQRLEVIGEDADGAKRAYGFLSDDPQPKFLPGERMVKFSLVVTCPYPRKLGTEVSFPCGNGLCTVVNDGNAGSYPRIEVSGRVQSLTASFDGHVVTWSGNAYGLVVDFFDDMSASSGTITSDDGFEIPPGEHEVHISCSPASAVASIALSSAWR